MLLQFNPSCKLIKTLDNSRAYFHIKVRGFFRLRNAAIVGFTIYLIATCFGHTTIFRQKYIC
jgi:hypothetical protein